MNPATRALAGVIRHLARHLPPGRDDWVEAVAAESGAITAGGQQVSWLVGGVWLVVRQATVLYPVTRLVVYAAGAAGLWWISVINGLIEASVIGLSAIVVVMVTLPWMGRGSGRVGPVADALTARVIRVGGYVAIFVFLISGVGAAHFASQRFNQPPGHGDPEAWVEVFLILSVYISMILLTTARRSPVPVATLRIGVGAGVLAGLVVAGLTPFGGFLNVENPLLELGYLCAFVMAIAGLPIAAGAAATSRQARLGTTAFPPNDHLGPARQGLWAGLLAGGAGALVIGASTITMLYLMPQRVPIEWANPDPHVPHGTPFEVQMSVGDSVGTHLLYLIVGPLIGVVLSSVGIAVSESRWTRELLPANDQETTAKP
jgi:hypothetical protein